MSTPRSNIDSLLENDPDANQLRVFFALNDAMLATHRIGTDEDRASAEETARMLLTYAELPLIIRAHACMILGCSQTPGYLEYAREAVRIAELARSRATTIGPIEDQLLAYCQQVLGWAQADYDADGGYPEEEDEETTVEEDELPEALAVEGEERRGEMEGVRTTLPGALPSPDASALYPSSDVGLSQGQDTAAPGEGDDGEDADDEVEVEDEDEDEDDDEP